MSSASFELHGQTAVITMNNPPVNGLGVDLRREIVEGLARAEADADVKAVVLIGSPRAFSGGADIREFGSPKSTEEPSLNTVIRALEGASKPVVAAIGGACMGGGLEVAMACHYRVAVKGAQISLPEVKLGLMPGAGGTQRLPRLIGAEAALNMIVSGETVASEKLAGTALFDAMIEADLLEGALVFARKVAEARPLKRVRDIKLHLPNAEGFFQFARNTVRAAVKNLPAPLKCVDAVAAAVALPFEEGMRLERELFMQLMQSSESRALRHAFFSERAAAKIPDVPEDTPLRKIGKIAVIGAGTMGSGITANFLSAGIPVTLLEAKKEALDRGQAVIRGIYEASAKKGRLTAQQVGERMAFLKPDRKSVV